MSTRGFGIMGATGSRVRKVVLRGGGEIDCEWRYLLSKILDRSRLDSR